MAVRNPQLATSYTVPQKNRIPGYGGFCPTVQKNYGLTYGTATKTFYDVNRKDVLNTSVKPFSHAHGDSGIGVVNSFVVAQPRPTSATTSNPWTKPLPYSLHLEGQRRDNVLNFEKFAQTHRTFYKDHTGTAQTIPGIHQRRHSAPSIYLKSEVSTVRFSPFQGSDNFSRIKSASGTRYIPPSRLGSARERAVRNAFFEKR